MSQSISEMETWKTLDIKQKFAVGSAVIAFFVGWGLSIAAFILPPVGEIHDSVLWVLGQALVYTASVLGIGMYIGSEIKHLRRETGLYIDKKFKEERDETESR